MFRIFDKIASLRFQQISETFVYEEIGSKEELSCISIYSLSIMYNSNFILMATLLEQMLSLWGFTVFLKFSKLPVRCKLVAY